jgi:hypothetical protein
MAKKLTARKKPVASIKTMAKRAARRAIKPSRKK